MLEVIAVLLVGLFAVGIAILQYETSRNQLKLSLLEVRMPVHTKTEAIYRDIKLNSVTPSEQRLRDLYDSIERAQFAFHDDLIEALYRFHELASEIVRLQRNPPTYPGDYSLKARMIDFGGAGANVSVLMARHLKVVEPMSSLEFALAVWSWCYGVYRRQIWMRQYDMRVALRRAAQRLKNKRWFWNRP
jgi:hypothetical protein